MLADGDSSSTIEAVAYYRAYINRRRRRFGLGGLRVRYRDQPPDGLKHVLPTKSSIEIRYQWKVFR